jgi:hypothetical protein
VRRPEYVVLIEDQALSFPNHARSQAAIEEKLANLPQSICFSHHVGAASWNEDEQQLVLGWVDYAWSAII